MKFLYWLRWWWMWQRRHGDYVSYETLMRLRGRP